MVGQQQPRRCSFCGRRERSVDHLVQTRAASICDRCAAQLAELLQAAPAQPRVLKFKPHLSLPPDRAAAEQEIEAAYDLVFDGTAAPERRAAAIEDGENLASSVRESSQRTPGSADMDIFVDYTRFLTEDEAEVHFTLVFPTGSPVPQWQDVGYAVLTSDGWKVARATWCALVARVGVHCPPAEIR
jgi:hypothetical protein